MIRPYKGPQRQPINQPRVGNILDPLGDGKKWTNVWGAVMNVPQPSGGAPVSPTPTPTSTETPTPTPSITPTNTITPSITPTNTITPTVTPTSSLTPTPSITPTSTLTPTVTPTNTVTPTSSVTPTPSITPTNTITPTVTPTNTPTPSASPIPAGYTEADTYLTAVVNAGGTGITSTISASTRTLFNSLFVNNLYTKLDYMYLFIGGTAASHKFNAKNPVDTDAAFRLTFNGGWTHNSSGATPNGVNGYATTYYIPSSAGTITDNSGQLTLYTSQTGSSKSYPIDMGTTFYGGGFGLCVGMPSATNIVGYLYGSIAYTDYALSAQTGPLTLSRTAFNRWDIYRRGNPQIFGTESPGSDKQYLTEPMLLGASYLVQGSTPDNYSDRPLLFASVGQGLSQSEVQTLHTIINTYQTSLGRNTY